MKKLICALLCMLCLAGCGAPAEAPTQTTQQPSTAVPTTVPETTAPPEPVLAEGVFWNLDRQEYAGKSEAGMSSRTPGEDGLYRVRFFRKGEVLELTVANKQVINKVDANDLMGLQLDENGVVVGVVRLDDMPVETVAWQFYVESIDGNTVVCNSSMSLNGMQETFALTEETGVYDMTGKTQLGASVKLKKLDKVLVVCGESGTADCVFVYTRGK